MAPAWLDSLSEDWVSQAGSDASRSSPAGKVQTTNKLAGTTASSRKSTGRSAGSIRHIHELTPANSSNILSERSANEINIFGSRRAPSKLSNELEIRERGRPSRRSVSASSLGSVVVHDTVQHKSHSASPGKGRGDTPEWRRRLVYGDIAYGEQRDLFTSARVGLENMFNPPSTTAPIDDSAAIQEEEVEDEQEERQEEQDEVENDALGEEEANPYAEHEPANDQTMPSSPPIRLVRYDSSACIHDESFAQQLPEQPRETSSDVLREPSQELEQTGEGSGDEEEDSVLRHAQRSEDREDAASPSGIQIHHSMERESRMVSGQSVLRNESFSAIMISPEKYKGDDDAVFGPVELPPGELKRRLENLRRNQMVLADDVIEGAEQSVSIGGKSLNVDNTEEYEKMGGFINFRRGGRSADGSFRDRLLSPPLENDSSEMLPEESLQASTPKQFSTIRTEHATLDKKRSPILPRVPNPSPEKRGSLPRQQQQQQQQSAAGSPLKLFGPYDTFTNQTLMRRISQFEDQMSNGSRASADRSTDEPSKSEMEKAFVASPQKSMGTSQQHESRHSSAQFGAGELNEYRFGEDFSRLSLAELHTENATVEGHSLQVSQIVSKPVFPLNLSEKKSSQLNIQRLRQSRSAMSSRPSTAEKWTEPVDSAASAGKIPQLATPRRVAEVGSEGKRPRTSPSKDPTPKRRRTLHKSDIAFGMDDSRTALDSVYLSHHNMQSVMGRLRRDAHGGDESQSGKPAISADHQFLRPRTPTPSQRSSVQREKNPNVDDADNGFDSHADMGHASVRDGAEVKNYAVWSESSLGGPPGPASGPVSDGERKPSIRTEDFMNEAHKIMAMLRSRGGAVQSGLTSVEESEMETPEVAEQSEEADGSFQESTKEPFSRPPSREGGPIPRVPRVQENPELVARLKKYEERSDLDDIVTSTTRSISMAQDAIRAEKEAARVVQDAIGTVQGRTRLDENDDISDPPNIRISANPRQQRQHLEDPFNGHDDNPSQASQGSMSSGNSTGRSIPTGSSRGSDTRKTIAPQTVSHLIPDQVGNMVLDRDRNIWIKRRSGSGGGMTSVQSTHTILPSEGSEEDPFADIPDLSVDVTMELHNLKTAATPGPARTAPPSQSPPKSARPVLVTKSQFSALNARNALDEERNQVASAGDDRDTAVEHEISIDEDRVSRSTPSKKRHLAISFSSPIASIIQDFVVEEDNDSKFDRSAVDDSLQNTSAASVKRGRRTVSVKFKSTAGNTSVISTRSRSTSRGPSRTISVAGQAFVPRPISRIDEREEETTNHSRHSPPVRNRELSLIGDRSEVVQVPVSAAPAELSQLPSPRQASFSMVMTTPGPAPRADDEQVMTQYVGMLSLSPMSEFTIHQDRSLALEASYVMGDRHLVTGDGSKTVMSQSLSKLVDRLAEVQPFEPYWEDIEELDVQGKSLESLHKLDDFCPQLVTLDAAGNSLRNLSGIPMSVRHLRVVHNQLSELTSWATLANLQYLDISNNDIKTLSGLKYLVHLRGLKADNCNLETLEGIKYHDALQTLRVRGNKIESVDFDGTRLQKLVELDLESNQITSVSNLDQLVSLATLNLRQNALGAFSPSRVGALPHLRSLNLSDNKLAALDVRSLPQLRLLHADRNRLARVRGFSKTPRLDSVSLREQTLAASDRLDISSLYHAYEIRKLYLSGNRLDKFDPPVDFLNLQLLELANCGLTSLPAKFGLVVPNLRKLNLNFNAMTDLASLRGIPRLKKVLVAGNRLAHAYSVIRVLAEFPHLTEVDLRDNPVTQGFYPHVYASSAPAPNSQVTGEASHKDGSTSASPEPFVLPRADTSQDKAYCSRLDLATGMRRRVYDQVFADACRKLGQLDGLPVDRAIGDLRDAVWEALNAKGIISKKGAHKSKEAGCENEKETRDESRWGAEDTFA